jgi:exonuclease III
MYDKNRLQSPEEVVKGIGLNSADVEGRAVTLTWTLPPTTTTGASSSSSSSSSSSLGYKLSLVNVYSPNSGQDLKRLGFRCKEWDPQLFSHLSSLQGAHDDGKNHEKEEKKIRNNNVNVLLCGDLNVAYSDSDFYNPQEKRSRIYKKEKKLINKYVCVYICL